MKPAILVCDDHPMLRKAVAQTLATEFPGHAIIEADNFPAAWAQVKAHGPVVIVSDLVMPGAEPLDGIAGLMAAAPDTPILAFTGSFDNALMVELLTRGVHGFLAKSASGELIAAALRVLLSGGRYIPHEIMSLVSTNVDGNGAAPRLAELSQRQREVLGLVAEGKSNKEIARLLAVAPSTVKSHLETAMRLLDTANRTQAALRARELGLV